MTPVSESAAKSRLYGSSIRYFTC